MLPVNDQSPDVIVISQSQQPERSRFAQQLAERLGVPCAADPTAASIEYRLIVGDDSVELCDETMKPGRGVRADFSSLDVRTGSGGLSRNQPIARAVGKDTQTVLDATAGMGQDAFLLACLGYEVTMLERSPIVAALLHDALRRAADDSRLSAVMGNRLRLIEADARDVLRELAQGHESARPDVVYLDPMFPPKRKQSALPRKEIQALRRVVGDDPDVNELFELARSAARRRVIVKRPIHALPIAPNPVASHEGKLARFDVYVSPPQRREQ